MGEHQHDEILRLREDQAKWRKGVALIAAYLGEKQPDNLCCVRIANVALKMRAERDSLRAQVERLESVPDVIARLRSELKLMERKVITCGVAATNPDAGLTLRDGYMQWTSPQADAVRALRAERDSLRADLSEALRLLREANAPAIRWGPRADNYTEDIDWHAARTALVERHRDLLRKAQEGGA